MVRYHHRLSGHEFEQTLGDSEGQGNLACCSPWACEELDTPEGLNNNKDFVGYRKPYFDKLCVGRKNDSPSTLLGPGLRVCAKSCLTLCDPMDCSLPGSSVHGIFQAIILEWVAISYSRGSSQPRNQT